MLTGITLSDRQVHDIVFKIYVYHFSEYASIGLIEDVERSRIFCVWSQPHGTCCNSAAGLPVVRDGVANVHEPSPGHDTDCIYLLVSLLET